MKEFELEYLLTETGIAAVETFGMYVSITVAYLVAAFVTGKNLSRSQAFIVTTLFLITAAVMTWATAGYILRAISFADVLEAVNPDKNYAMQPPVLIVVFIVQSLGILASLKFMWDVRHSRAE